MNDFINKTRSYLGLKRNVVLILILTIIMIMGERLWERFLPVYLESVGASYLVLGGLGFLTNFIGAFWALNGGYVFDKYGAKKSFIIFNLLAICGYIIAILFKSWYAVFAGFLFFSAWNNLALPASMSVITGELGKTKSVMGISMHSIIRRIPMIIGPLIGGILIDSYGINNGMTYIFIAAAAICVIGILMVKSFTVKHEETSTKYSILRLWKNSGKQFKNLLVSDILVRFCEQIPYVFVVLWCMNIVKVSAGEFGLLTAIEMITAAVCYIPVAHFSDHMEKKPFVLITFGFFTIFPLILYFSNGFVMLVVAFIIRGLKEFGEPTRKAMILELAISDAKARSFGFYYFLRDGIVAFAGFAGGLLWGIHPSVNLFAAFGFGVMGTIYFWVFGKGIPAAGRNSFN